MSSQIQTPVTPLKVSDLAQAEETLALAFREDPMTGFLLRRDKDPVRKLRWLFRTELRYAFSNGLVETIDSGKAFAVWMPPKKATGAASDLLRSGAIGAPIALGWISTWRVIRLMRGMASLHAKLTRHPHW